MWFLGFLLILGLTGALVKTGIRIYFDIGDKKLKEKIEAEKEKNVLK